MTQEDKNSLLNDLCARLPYRLIVKVKIINLREEQYAKDSHPSRITHPTYENNGYLYSVDILSQSVRIRPILKHLEYREQVYFEKICNDGYINIENVKPYLRSLSSMTEEEKEQMRDLWIVADGKTHATRLIDFYNKNNFDFRGLIEKGLATEVTEDNNPYKD